MTQRLGNAGAQKAVRAHNTAVRGAIESYKGREVKHTGDGIMATFPNPAAAVAASIKIQREIAAHNSANPAIDVHLRIGINAGEAVEEENDFFGAAVQMTARICDKATKDNIWVSQTVVDACKGQKFGFIPRGGFEMKGIQGAKRLFEVGWNDSHKNELADL
jgi:adenylate cyclase